MRAAAATARVAVESEVETAAARVAAARAVGARAAAAVAGRQG